VNAQREGWQDPHVNVYATYGQGVNVEKDSTMYERQKKELALQAQREDERKKLAKAQDFHAFCLDLTNMADDECEEYWKARDFDGEYARRYPQKHQAEVDRRRQEEQQRTDDAARRAREEQARVEKERCDGLFRTGGAAALCVPTGCPADQIRCCPYYSGLADQTDFKNYCPQTAVPGTGTTPGGTTPGGTTPTYTQEQLDALAEAIAKSIADSVNK
ncbi:MAG: hypothetical protein LBL46_02835, partial [Rickettsiales bacterium]|nr:hypothetical protein [Rickettsiales bacterium]